MFGLAPLLASPCPYLAARTEHKAYAHEDRDTVTHTQRGGGGLELGWAGPWRSICTVVVPFYTRLQCALRLVASCSSPSPHLFWPPRKGEGRWRHFSKEQREGERKRNPCNGLRHFAAAQKVIQAAVRSSTLSVPPQHAGPLNVCTIPRYGCQRPRSPERLGNDDRFGAKRQNYDPRHFRVNFGAARRNDSDDTA